MQHTVIERTDDVIAVEVGELGGDLGDFVEDIVE
jgi:hypothetical protein